MPWATTVTMALPILTAKRGSFSNTRRDQLRGPYPPSTKPMVAV